MNQLLWYYADLEKQACMNDLRANNNETTMQAVPGRKSSKVNLCYTVCSKSIILIRGPENGIGVAETSFSGGLMP